MRSAASRSTRCGARASSRIAPDHRYHSVVFTLDDLVDASGGKIIHGRPQGDERLSGGAFDTRLNLPREAFFSLRDHRHGGLKTAASFNNEIGVPLTFPSLEPIHEVAVIEMGF